MICEVEPLKPSTRLTRERLATRATGSGKSEIGNLKSEIDKDLDWIVMKCFEKDRSRRYETANDLATDIRRHLNSEPVLAAAPSAVYRTGKFVRRHRTALTVATGMIGLLLLGLMATTWQAVRATWAERAAVLEGTANREVALFWQELLEGVRPSIALGRDTALLRELVDKAATRVEKELKHQPRAEAHLLSTIGVVYRDLGEHSQAERMFREALAIETRLHGPEHPHVARAQNLVAELLTEQGKLKEAEALLRQALALQKKTPPTTTRGDRPLSRQSGPRPDGTRQSR
ncbi:MAG: tetratricopeptide repeat protein [Pedosphaera sp.]|nr:tetratricopeptide repeat protein [Pedosphaera sp.]